MAIESDRAPGCVAGRLKRDQTYRRKAVSQDMSSVPDMPFTLGCRVSRVLNEYAAHDTTIVKERLEF